MTPFVTWGTNPGPGRAARRGRARPRRLRGRGRPDRRREGLGVHGSRGRHPDARGQGRHRLRRLVHQRPHRGPAARRRDHQGPPGRRDTRLLVVPGSVRVRLQAEDEGLDVVFKEAGGEWRGAGCSMCLGMNPDQLAPGERSASTSNRNFEGRQGKGGRTHLVSVPVAAATAVRGTLARPPTCRRSAARPRKEPDMEKFTTPHRRRRAAAAQQRRHRPDHPGGLPQAGHPHRLRGRAVRRLAQRPGVRPQPAGVRRGLGARRRPRLRHRLLARARGVGAAELRLQGRDLAALRRHLPRQLRQGRAARGAGRREGRRSGCGTSSRPTRAPTITVDLESRTVQAGEASTRSRTPSTSTTTPGGGCSRASTTSASRCPTRTTSRRTSRRARPGSPPLSRVSGRLGRRPRSSAEISHETANGKTACSALWRGSLFPSVRE